MSIGRGSNFPHAIAPMVIQYICMKHLDLSRAMWMAVAVYSLPFFAFAIMTTLHVNILALKHGFLDGAAVFLICA